MMPADHNPIPETVTDDRRIAAEQLCSQVRFNTRGLVPVVAQDAKTGDVLMVAWTDRSGLLRTLLTGEGTYFSRSRGEPWVKGATSGHRQTVLEVRLDCDADSVLYRVRQEGPACHTGDRSCFDAGGWQC